MRRNKKKPTIALAIILAFLLSALVAINVYQFQKDAIITADSTYLMEGPSGAANAVTILNKGHKVYVLEKDDVWAKVKLEGTVAFLRSSKIKEII